MSGDRTFNVRIDLEKLLAVTRELVIHSDPQPTALVLREGTDGERLHRELREALGISFEDWQRGE